MNGVTALPTPNDFGDVPSKGLYLIAGERVYIPPLPHSIVHLEIDIFMRDFLLARSNVINTSGQKKPK